MNQNVADTSSSTFDATSGNNTMYTNMTEPTSEYNTGEDYNASEAEISMNTESIKPAINTSIENIKTSSEAVDIYENKQYISSWLSQHTGSEESRIHHDPSLYLYFDTATSSFQPNLQTANQYITQTHWANYILFDEEAYQGIEFAYLITEELERLINIENWDGLADGNIESIGDPNSYTDVSSDLRVLSNTSAFSEQQHVIQNDEILQYGSSTGPQTQVPQCYEHNTEDNLGFGNSGLQTTETMLGAMPEQQPSSDEDQVEEQALWQHPMGLIFTPEELNTATELRSDISEVEILIGLGYVMNSQHPVDSRESLGFAHDQRENNGNRAQTSTTSNNNITASCVGQHGTYLAMAIPLNEVASEHHYNDPVGERSQSQEEDLDTGDIIASNPDSASSQEESGKPENSHTWTRRPDYANPRVKMTEEECNWLQPGRPERDVFKTAKAKAEEKRRLFEEHAEAEVKAGRSKPTRDPEQPIRCGFHISPEEAERLNE